MIYKNNIKTEDKLQRAGGDEGLFLEWEVMRLGRGTGRVMGKSRGVVADGKGGSGEKLAEDRQCGVAEMGVPVDGAHANTSKCENGCRSGCVKAGQQSSSPSSAAIKRSLSHFPQFCNPYPKLPDLNPNPLPSNLIPKTASPTRHIITPFANQLDPFPSGTAPPQF